MAYLPLNLILEYSINGFEKNTMIHNLRYGGSEPFTYDDIWEVIKLYRLGNIDSGYLFGGTVYPFIDERHRVRAMQVKTYDQANYETGGDWIHTMTDKRLRRDKQTPPEWLTSYMQAEAKVTCLFGAHLIREYPNNPIAIATNPKAAIYGALYFGLPESDSDFVWLSTYEADHLRIDRLMILQGKTVCLFPDMRSIEDWRFRAKYLSSKVPGIKLAVSDMVEKLAKPDDQERGILDLSDYLRQFKWTDFRKPKEVVKPKETTTYVYKEPYQTDLMAAF